MSSKIMEYTKDLSIVISLYNEEESLSEFITPNYDDIEENTDVEYVQDSNLKNVIAMKPKTKRKMS